MNNFQKEFEQRLRRVCGVTDDNLFVKYEEFLNDGFSECTTCDPESYGSFDYGPAYTIEVWVYREIGTYKTETVAQRTFNGMVELIKELEGVEL